MKLTFYIIYTPNSVKYLIDFIPSLLEYTGYKFCLVSNGCSFKERIILQNVASRDKRLTYYCYPTNQMQIHGKVLTHLQARCQEEYFCFMDSDIFATKELPDLEQILAKENLTALFTAMPLWVKKSEYIFKRNFKGMAGTFNQMDEDVCLGSTYFAIYKNEDLSQIIQHYGVCFDECKRSKLPIDIQNELQKLGYYQKSFDTAKVINLLLLKHKLLLKNIETSELCHIGGVSYETTYQNNQRELKVKKQQIKKWLLSSPLKLIWLKYDAYRKEKILKNRFPNVSKEEFQINYNQRILHRNITRKHFLELYLSITSKKDLPLLPVFQDEEITRNVRIAHQSYISNFNKYINYWIFD